MPNVNCLILAGHATRSPEIKALPTTNIIKFGLAVNNRVKRGEQWVDEPMFIDVTTFQKNTSYIANGLHKGAAVLVEGRLQLEQWDDKTTGAKRSKHTMIAEDVHLLGPKGERQTAAKPQANDAPPAGGDEPIPF